MFAWYMPGRARTREGNMRKRYAYKYYAYEKKRIFKMYTLFCIHYLLFHIHK